VAVTIKLLYFAAIREIVGRAEEALWVPPEVTTIGALAAHLEKTIPSLEGRLAAVRWARNETFVAFDERLEDQDVVALIPPVAGGSR
jgi:sulfur-carrier protein